MHRAWRRHRIVLSPLRDAALFWLAAFNSASLEPAMKLPRRKLLHPAAGAAGSGAHRAGVGLSGASGPARRRVSSGRIGRHHHPHHRAGADRAHGLELRG